MSNVSHWFVKGCASGVSFGSAGWFWWSFEHHFVDVCVLGSKWVEWIIQKTLIMCTQCFRIIPISDGGKFSSIKCHIIDRISRDTLILHRIRVAWIRSSSVIHIAQSLFKSSLMVINSVEWDGITRKKLSVRVSRWIKPVRVDGSIVTWVL